MDWSKLRRDKVKARKPSGVYADLEELIRIQFKARDFSFLPTQPVSSVLSGRFASRLRGRGLNFEELRQYRPGDDVRTIDWKVTARTRKPHVRVFTEEKDRAVLLVVDQRINMFFGTRNRMKSVTAAELAALAAWRAKDVGDRVGGVVFNDSEMIDHAPKGNQPAVMSILGSLIRMNHLLQADQGPSSSPDMLNKALVKAGQLAPHDALVIIVSDFDGINEETERQVSKLAGHNDVLAVLVHDPIRMSPPTMPLSVSNGALQIDLNFNDRTIREKVLNDYKSEEETIRHFLRKLKTPLLTISNEGDVVGQIRKLLGVPGRDAR